MGCISSGARVDASPEKADGVVPTVVAEPLPKSSDASGKAEGLPAQSTPLADAAVKQTSSSADVPPSTVVAVTPSLPARGTETGHELHVPPEPARIAADQGVEVSSEGSDGGLPMLSVLSDGDKPVGRKQSLFQADSPPPSSRPGTPHSLLPPPGSVTRLLNSDFEHGSSEHGELARAAVPWLIEALAHAHKNKEVKLAARRLLATADFSLTLSVDKAWEPLMNGVKGHLQRLGRPLQTHSKHFVTLLNSERLKIRHQNVTAGDPEGLSRRLSGQARLDCKGFLCVPPWDWQDPIAMCEQVWIHVIRLLALALNERFGAKVNKALEGVAEVSVADIKSFVRMRNKMAAKDDHRFARRPRPSRNVDVNRSLCVVDDEAGMRELCKRCAEQFGVVKVKNGFDLSEPDAAACFELRVMMLTLRFDAGRSYGQIASDPNVQKAWQAYADGDAEEGVPRTRWREHALRALDWLQSSSIRDKPVVTMVEVQAVLRPYYVVRQDMHELYKAFRAENGTQLYLDFLRALPKQPRQPEDEATSLWEAADWGQAGVASLLALEKSDRLDEKDDQGYTPLLICAEKGHFDVAKVLIDAGATSLDTPSGEGENTPLLWCSQKGFASLAKLLVDAGAKSLDTPDAQGMTPLLWCAQEGHPDVANVLVSGGARSLDIPDHDGSTPLVWCAQEGSADVAKVLLQGGARSLETPRADGLTPLLICADRGFFDVAMSLVTAGADLNAAVESAKKSRLSAELEFFKKLEEYMKPGAAWLT